MTGAGLAFMSRVRPFIGRAPTGTIDRELSRDGTARLWPVSLPSACRSDGMPAHSDGMPAHSDGMPAHSDDMPAHSDDGGPAVELTAGRRAAAAAEGCWPHSDPRGMHSPVV